MTLYFVNLTMLGIYSALLNMTSVYGKKVYSFNKKFFVSLASLQLILVLALRHKNIGVDVEGYLLFFKKMPFTSFASLPDIHRFEIGYKLLNKVISLFTMNEQWFLAIIAIICIVPIGRLIYKYSKMPFLSFALYIAFNYYTFVFSGLRQGIAFAILAWGYSYILEKRLLKFLMAVVVAALFHVSAIFFIPAYFLTDIKLNLKFWISILIANLLIYFLKVPIFSFIVNNFYTTYEIVISDAYTWMALCWFIIIVGLLFRKQIDLTKSENNFIFTLLIVGATIMNFASVGTNVMRVADYYYMYVILFLPMVIDSITDRLTRYVALFCVMIGIYALYSWSLGKDGYSIVPYMFFWE